MISLVIVGGDQPRSTALHRQLIATGLFEIHIQPRINEIDLPRKLGSDSSSKWIYGRELSISEKCCAFAHLQAQQKLSATGGIILEDDAVILDYHQLAHFGSLVANSNNNILLNLSTERCEEEVDWTLDKNNLIRTFGPTALAVGYAASSLEMQQLAKVNSDLRFIADWPPTLTKHFRLKKPIVAHGYSGTQSIISVNTNRKKVGLIKLIHNGHFFAAYMRIIQKIHFEVTRVILLILGASK